MNLVRTLTLLPDVHVVTIDYRGFGESEGSPSEEGLVEDAISAYQWIHEQCTESSPQIVIYGQSLGTGVATRLAKHLCDHANDGDGGDEGGEAKGSSGGKGPLGQGPAAAKPAALILDAPFTCLQEAALHHSLTRDILR